MDPDATLEMIRDNLAEIEASGGTAQYRAMLELVENVTNILEWLDRGGFVPDAWSDKEREK